MNYRERQYREIIEAVAQLFDDLTLSNTASEVRKMVKEVEALPDDFAPDLTFEWVEASNTQPGDRVLIRSSDGSTSQALTVHAVDADFGEVILRFGNDKVDRFLPDFLLRVSRG